MRDTIITRRPSLPNRRKTDLALFAICFLFLLFSAFILSPTRGGAGTQVLEERTASKDRPEETCTNSEYGAGKSLYASKPFRVAGCSDLNDKKITSTR